MRVHGESTRRARTKEYGAWLNVKNRCLNPNYSQYADYGGRGITICDEWRDDFGAFLAGVGRAPSPDLTLDRIDNTRGYEPGNVRWATRAEQLRNTRKNIYVEVNGRQMCLREASRLIGVHNETLRNWIRRGMTPQQAVDQGRRRQIAQ